MTALLKMKKLLLSIVALLCAATASAQEPGDWTIGPRLGIYTNVGDTVIGVGAAAVTKLKAPFSNLIERVFNFKYPYEYINRFDELLERIKVIRVSERMAYQKIIKTKKNLIN